MVEGGETGEEGTQAAFRLGELGPESQVGLDGRAGCGGPQMAGTRGRNGRGRVSMPQGSCAF